MKTKNQTYLENYEEVSEEIKHVSNSLIRLAILFALYEGDKTMKEINQTTGLSYSAISSNMRILETGGYAFRESGKYSLENVMRIYIKNLSEFNGIIGILKEFFNMFEAHRVRSLPGKAVCSLYLMEKGKLIESTGINAYKISSIVTDSVKGADWLKAVLPISFRELTENICESIEKGNKTELKISSDIFGELTKNMDLEMENLKAKKLNDDFGFLLIVSDKSMVFGLYKKDGSYDQNRILTSGHEDCLKWANMLFDSV